MDRILRGEGDWQGAIAGAMLSAPRPIPADPRLLPRELTGAADPRRWDRTGFPPARRAGTLLLIYPAGADGLTVPLTLRRADLRSHAGEVSLPGGAVEPGDASAEAAALREAHEEIGVDPGAVTIVGSLDSVWIPVSNFELFPFVGVSASRPEIRPALDEVEAVVELPLSHLADESSLAEEVIEGDGWRLRAGVYRYGGQRIWGATARTLAMFATVLRGLSDETLP